MVSLKLIYKAKYKENMHCVLHIAIFFKAFLCLLAENWCTKIKEDLVVKWGFRNKLVNGFFLDSIRWTQFQF